MHIIIDDFININITIITIIFITIVFPVAQWGHQRLPPNLVYLISPRTSPISVQKCVCVCVRVDVCMHVC